MICSCNIPRDGQVQVNGKTVRFEYTRIFGPLLVDRRGEPLKRQPIAENHPFWAPFNEWLAQHHKEKT